MLTAIEMICRVLSFYPLWLLLLSLCPPDAMRPAMGILFAAGLVTAFGSRLLRQKLRHRKRLAFWLSALWMAVSAALCAYLCLMPADSLAISILLAAVTVIFTHRKADADNGELFGINAYVAFLTCSVIASVMLWAAHQDLHLSLTLSVTGGVSAMYLLLRNQLMLQRLVNRRSAAETAVPAEIRRANLMLVFGIIALLAVVFIFHTPLVHFLEWLHQSMIKLVYAVGRFFYHLVDRFSGEVPEDAQELFIEEEAEMPPLPQKSNPLWLLLWIPFIAVAYIIWREFLSDWVYDIKMFLIDLSARLRKRDSENGAVRRTETEEYYDTETTLRREKKDRSRRRTWLRALRQWQGMPENSEKFYAGYRLLLAAPDWQAGLLQKSDTVREIREKWAAFYSPEHALDAVTEDFHSDRYAERGLPQEAIRDLENALMQVRSLRLKDDNQR